MNPIFATSLSQSQSLYVNESKKTRITTIVIILHLAQVGVTSIISLTTPHRIPPTYLSDFIHNALLFIFQVITCSLRLITAKLVITLTCRHDGAMSMMDNRAVLVSGKSIKALHVDTLHLHHWWMEISCFVHFTVKCAHFELQCMPFKWHAHSKCRNQSFRIYSQWASASALALFFFDV